MKNNYFITIDGGTTNTRIYLWDNENSLIDRIGLDIGVRDTAIDGDNQRLKIAIGMGIKEVLNKNSLTDEKINKIIASGMLTSNVGLVEIPHIVAPVSLEKISSGIESHLIEEIFSQEIYFIPGIKNFDDKINLDNFEKMDMMRGEEVETFAILDNMKNFHEDNYLIILPGSHIKIVSVNKDKEITGCLTSISGELLSVITNNTILASTLKKEFLEDKNYNKELLVEGYKLSQKVGLSRACFSTRILGMFTSKNSQQLANFLLGAVLAEDLLSIRNSLALEINPKTQVVISGKSPLERAIYDLLKEENYFQKIEIYDALNDHPLSGIGALLIGK